jgi:hypothetical protein
LRVRNGCRFGAGNHWQPIAGFLMGDNCTAIAQEKAGNPTAILKSMSDNMDSKSNFSINTTSFYDERFEDQMIKNMVTHGVDEPK